MENLSNENKQIVEDFYKFWETGSKALLEKTTSIELKDHDKDPRAKGTDFDALLGLSQAVNAGLSELKHTFIQVFTLEVDKIMIRWSASAKHTGEAFGLAATGNTVYFCGHDILQIKNSKIVELWHIEQLLQLTAQMQ